MYLLLKGRINQEGSTKSTNLYIRSLGRLGIHGRTAGQLAQWNNRSSIACLTLAVVDHRHREPCVYVDGHKKRLPHLCSTCNTTLADHAFKATSRFTVSSALTSAATTTMAAPQACKQAMLEMLYRALNSYLYSCWGF